MGRSAALKDSSPAQFTSELRSDHYRRSLKARNGRTPNPGKEQAGDRDAKLVGGTRLYVSDLPQRKHV